MFRIGDFSRIARVSARLLRFYDEIGLLRPAHADPATGYRFYSVSQLGLLNRILVLKDLEPKLPAGDDRRLEALAVIAESYNASGDPDEALKTLKQLSAATRAGSAWKLEAFRQMGDIYEKKEAWADAAAAYEEGGRSSSNPQVTASFRQRAKYLRENYLGKAPAKTTGRP